MDTERDLRWKKLDSKTVYKDQWLQVIADRCEFPDGRIIEPYYVVVIPDWCNIIVATKDERIILVRQYRYAADITTFELPGGIIDKNETPLAAAIREMKEETGYVSDDIEMLMQLSPNPALNNNTAYFFLARNAEPTGTHQFDTFEDLDTISFSKTEIQQLLRDNKMQHGVQVGPIYQALLKLGWISFVK